MSVVVPPDMEALPGYSDKTCCEAGCFLLRCTTLASFTVQFSAGDSNTGVTFAIPGPFKAVAELVGFPRLWTFSIDVKDGKLS
jgi:hypothetical protein